MWFNMAAMEIEAVVKRDKLLEKWGNRARVKVDQTGWKATAIYASKGMLSARTGARWTAGCRLGRRAQAGAQGRRE